MLWELQPCSFGVIFVFYFIFFQSRDDRQLQYYHCRSLLLPFRINSKRKNKIIALLGELVQVFKVGLLQWPHLPVDDSHYKGVWRSGILVNRAPREGHLVEGR